MSETNYSQITGLFNLIKLDIKHLKELIEIEEPVLAMEKIESLERDLNMLKEIALVHEQIIDEIIAKQQG